MTTLVELCAGTAAVSLRALAGPAGLAPLTGYMGSKRRWATTIADVLGFGHEPPDRVLLVDAGPWGDVWSVLANAQHRRAVIDLLNSYATWRHHPDRALESAAGHGEDGVQQLWRQLVQQPPLADPHARVVQFLWLQARSASNIPIWWCPERERWESPTGSRTETAHQRGGQAAGSRQSGPAAQTHAGTRCKGQVGSGPARGIQSPATIARRVQALDALPWDRIEVIHGDVREVDPIPRATVYFDPPYHRAPRYAALLPRRDVLNVAVRWTCAGARVVVSESVTLPFEGWSSLELPGPKPEWLTCSFDVRQAAAHQMEMWSGASA